MPDQNVGRVDIGRREQRMQLAGDLVGIIAARESFSCELWPRPTRS
jgi:hypothetical protein